MLFEKVTIVGFGLIGSSLARCIRRDGLAREIICVDRDREVCRAVMDMGLADSAMTDLRQGVEGSDLVVLAVPVGVCGAVAEQMRYSLRLGAIVTDVGSVKRAVVDSVLPYLPASVHFIPAHPIAGTEHSGPAAGFAELFAGRWCIITPLPDSDIRAVEKITRLWESCGCRIELMDVRRHDLILGITSHLPHLIAYTIVGTATDLEEDTKDDVIKFSASGFRDFTRIAASDPVMWRDIFLNNREAVLDILQRFTEDLTAMQKAIRKGDGDHLQGVFTRTRAVRCRIIEAGQADCAISTSLPEPPQSAAGRQKASGSAG